jgi:hypothetical protein
LCKHVEAEIDEDKVFRQLGNHSEHVLCRSLSSRRHGMVCIMLERDSAE